MKLLPIVLPLALLASAAQAEVSPKVVKSEAKAFARADKDGDEKISYDEFEALLKALPKALKKFPVTGRGDDPAELLELCEGVFDYFDANADGFVDFNEWLIVRQEYDLQEMAGLLTSLPGLDRNGNGKVRVTEFLPLVKCFIPASHAKKIYRHILGAYVASGGSASSNNFNISYGSVEIVVVGSDWGNTTGSTANSSSGVRGSGGPQTGTPLVIGSGTTTGVTGAGVREMTVNTGITGAWSSIDLNAAAAWVSQSQGLTWQIIQLTDNPFPERTIQLPEAEAP